MKRVISVLVIVVGTMAVSGGVASAASSSTTSLSKELLSLHDMPAGWSVGNDAGANGVGCLENLLERAGSKQTAAAQVFYVHTGLLPAFDEKVATYANTKKAYTSIIKTINACHQVSGHSPTGHLVTGTVSKMKFTRVANASSAYAMRLTDAGITLRYDYVIARKKNVVIAVLEANAPAVSTSQFTSLVNKAVKKVH